MPAAALVARLFLERRLDWRPPVLLALGVALGLLVHPYSPHNMTFAALHLLPKVGLGGQEAVRVGAEWAAFSPAGFYTRAGPSLAVMSLGLLPSQPELLPRAALLARCAPTRSAFDHW